MRQLPILAALALFLVAPTAQAGLLGVELNATYYKPDLGTVYGPVAFTNADFVVGVENPSANIEGVTTLLVDFTDSRLTITFDTSLTNPKWDSADFNGPVFTLLSAGTLGITGATVNAPLTTMGGFGDTRVTFDDSHIRINWQDLSYVDGTTVVVDFAFVPEPSSVIALCVGCVLPVVATLRRRRRRLAA